MRNLICSFLPINELILALLAKNRSELVIAGSINRKAKTLTVVFGNFAKYSKPLSFFNISDNVTVPDFTKFKIIDCGHGLQFGDYEAASLVMKENYV